MNKLGLVDSPRHVVNFCVFLHVIDMTHIVMFSPYGLTYGPISAVHAVHFACLEIFSLSDDDIFFRESCRHLRPITGDG